jgi:hypothetical protein
VNENHNTRAAMMAAQSYPCGVGIESKLSTTTTGKVESYLAIRLGNHLDSLGHRETVDQSGAVDSAGTVLRPSRLSP